MHQRRRSPVILVCRVGIENLRHYFVLLSACEYTALEAGHWIRLLQVREWEDVGGVVEVEERPRIARWLRKLMIEVPASSSGNARPNAIKDSLPFLIAIEAL